MILFLVADHGPCVSGAHNTIVAARAGKDIVSCVCSGMWRRRNGVELNCRHRTGGEVVEVAIVVQYWYS